MPGPKRNRTKGNVKPSSSSRAAELLSQSGSTGFVGFSSVGGAQAYVPASQAFDDVDFCLDSDFRVVLRKLSKRDATTKIKTLGEFSSLCKEKEDATLQAVLPFWPRLFNKLAIDIDPKVREYTQNAMATLVSQVRRNLAPYLKNVMGAWILSRNDTYPTVASAADRSFSAAFPPEKQENAIVFCKQAILEYLIDNLLNQTPSSLSDPKTTEKEEMESKYQRVLSSSLMGLRQLLQTLPAAQVDNSLRGHLRGLLNEAKFWNQSKSQVRTGLLWFLGSLCQVVPDMAGEYVRKISPLVLGSIDIFEPGLTTAVWDAVLSLVKFVPACWENINWQKAFWPKLRKILETGCQGYASSVAANFLPLFSCIPMDTAGGTAIFFPKVLDLFKQGFAKDCLANSPLETNAWAKAFMECLVFSFKKISTEESSQDVLQAILLDQLLPVVEASLFDPKPTLSRSQLYTSMSSFLRTVASNTDTSGLATIFWSRLSTDLLEMFETVGSGEKQSLHPDRIVLFVRALLHPQDSSKCSSSKSEHVKFEVKESRHHPSDPVVVEVSDDVKSFVKKVVVQSHKLYRKDGQCVHLKLFVDLANLYFPEDIATSVLHSLESDSKVGSGERSAEAGEGTADTGESIVDAHSKVINQVVLPVLGGRKRNDNDAEVVDHTITFLFACLPFLSKKSSTDVWDNVLQTVGSTAALCSLVERALDKRQVMPQISDWLSSPRLHARLCDLVAMVTTQHSTMLPEELEQGWRVICLVLSANDNDGEPVFPSSWIVDIVNSVHQELVTLASRTLAQEEVQMAIQFVAKAALNFFQNLKMSLCMNEGRDVIVALLMADLDCGLPSSGEAASVLRQSWTTGVGLAVQDTGGYLQDGGILSSTCRVLRDTVLTKTHTMEQYKLVMEVTEELLRTTQRHLPQEDDENGRQETCNPVLMALLSELVVPLTASVADYCEIVQYHCLTGQLPLTVLDDLPAEGADHSPGMATFVFSSLFDLQLLQWVRSGCRLDAGDEESWESDGGEAAEWDELEEGILLDIMKSLVLATSWCKIESQAHPDLLSTTEDLTVAAHSCFSSSSKTLQHKVISKAFASIKEDALNTLTFTYLVELQSTRQGRVDKEYFQDLYSSEDSQNALSTGAVVGYLPQWNISNVFQLQVAILTSTATNTDMLTSIASCLHVMSAVLSKESAFISETYEDILHSTLNQLKDMRDGDLTPFLFSCVDNSSMTLHSSVSVQTFCMEACSLVAALACIAHHPEQHNEAVYPPNLKIEWTEFFAEGIYAFLFPLYIKLVDQLKETKRKEEAALILRAVGSAMAQCPQEQITGHNLPLSLAASDDTSPIPESLQTVLNYLCPMLTCTSPPAQVTAYALLDKIMALLPSYHKEQEAVAGTTASTSVSTNADLKSRPLPTALMKVIDDCAAAMDVVLAPFAMETTITIAPETEEYQFALGYLLAWQLLLHLFQSADSTGRTEYALYLKEHSSVQHLLAHLFHLMPHSPGSTSTGGPSMSKSHSRGSPFKPSSPEMEDNESPSKPVRRASNEEGDGDSWFSSSDLPLTPAGVGQLTDIQHASCRVYLHCLEVIPVLVRQWWKDQDRKSAVYVDKFTTKYVSQQRIRSEMQSVNNSDSSVKDIVVKANSITRQVTASYTAEELKADIRVTLPENYPLGEISVDAERHTVLKLGEWLNMRLQVSIFLQHQNGSIVEGLKLWKRNLDKKLEGVEECFICYAVIHATNLGLPRMPCGTCKKKFHSACLYEWLNSSQNATCPLCRSVFF